MAKWREDVTYTQQRSANKEDTGTSRSIKQRDMLATLKNMCENFDGFTGEFIAEYLKIVSAVIEG